MATYFEESGLQALVELARKLLERPATEDVVSYTEKFRGSFAKTLLSNNIYKYREILGSYISIASKAIELLVKVLNDVNDISINESRVRLAGLLGFSTRSSRCLFVELKEGIEFKKKYRRPGSVICMDPEKATYLVLADIASLLWTGMEKIISDTTV